MGFRLKAAPFFGIIGVAPPPEMGQATSIIPRAFGGNIDNKHLGKGATLHLPVFNSGALLSVGDGHALQGDGEVCVTAIETGLIGDAAGDAAKTAASSSPGPKRRRTSSPWRSIPISTRRRNPPCIR